MSLRCARRDRTLLLCYPPPASNMALTALTSYRGDLVCVIGEWDGDTGSAEFTAHLATEWELTHRVELPNWTDTAHDLTVWRRLKSANAEPSADCPRCCSCGAILSPLRALRLECLLADICSAIYLLWTNKAGHGRT